MKDIALESSTDIKEKTIKDLVKYFDASYISVALIFGFLVSLSFNSGYFIVAGNIKYVLSNIDFFENTILVTMFTLAMYLVYIFFYDKTLKAIYTETLRLGEDKKLWLTIKENVLSLKESLLYYKIFYCTVQLPTLLVLYLTFFILLKVTPFIIKLIHHWYMYIITAYYLYEIYINSQGNIYLNVHFYMFFVSLCIYIVIDLFIKNIDKFKSIKLKVDRKLIRFVIFCLFVSPLIGFNFFLKDLKEKESLVYIKPNNNILYVVRILDKGVLALDETEDSINFYSWDNIYKVSKSIKINKKL